MTYQNQLNYLHSQQFAVLNTFFYIKLKAALQSLFVTKPAYFCSNFRTNGIAHPVWTDSWILNFYIF